MKQNPPNTIIEMSEVLWLVKIKEYGPIFISMAWWYTLLLQPLIPNEPTKYITCQILILLSSFIIAYILQEVLDINFWVIHKN